MKKILFFIIVTALVLGFTKSNIFAQTKTPTLTIKQNISGTPSATPGVTAEQEADTIEKIKDLVASKVAELKLVDKRGILGKVIRVKSSQLIVEDHKRDQRSVDIDELTKFVSSKSSFGISDIKEADLISTIGLYNKDTKRLLGRFISLASSVPENISGVVVSRDPEEFTLKVLDPQGKSRTINIETSTKTNVWEENELAKSGFSKISIGERVIVIGFEDLKEKDVINASRVIHFPDIPLSNDLKKYEKNIEEEPTASPSATPRSTR